MALAVYAVVAVALIAAYVVVVVTGHDGTPLVTLLGGFIAGVGAQAGFRRTGAAPPP